MRKLFLVSYRRHTECAMAYLAISYCISDYPSRSLNTNTLVTVDNKVFHFASFEGNTNKYLANINICDDVLMKLQNLRLAFFLVPSCS